MKITNFSTYEFKEYNVMGIKAEINFSNKNKLKIILHEELEEPIQDQDISLINEFEPLLFSVDKEVARMQLLLDSTKVSLETVEKKYTSIITIKDKEIKRLSDLAMKDKADYSALWFTGGALAGIALTVAVIYAVQESK